MSKGVTLAIVVAMLTIAWSYPRAKSIVGWIAWMVVLVALIGALIVDAKGWP